MSTQGYQLIYSYNRNVNTYRIPQSQSLTGAVTFHRLNLDTVFNFFTLYENGCVISICGKSYLLPYDDN